MPPPNDPLANRLLEHSRAAVARERGLAELRLAQALKAQARRLAADTLGHAPAPDLANELPVMRSAIPGRDTDIDEILAVTQALEAGEAVPADANRSIRILYTSGSFCRFCGTGYEDAEAVPFIIEGATLRAERPCPTKPGPFLVELDIPSGVLAVGKDFRTFFPGTSVVGGTNFLMNERREAAVQAARGVLVLALHEDRSTLRRLKDGSFTVGDNYSNRTRVGTAVPETRILNGYWRSFADGRLIPADASGVARVPVKPGTYRFTIAGLDRAHDPDAPGTRVLARIRRTRRTA